MQSQRLEPITLIRVKRTPLQYYDTFKDLTDGFVDELFNGAKIILPGDAINPTLKHMEEVGVECGNKVLFLNDLHYWHIICSDDKLDFIIETLNQIPSVHQCKLRDSAKFVVRVESSEPTDAALK